MDSSGTNTNNPMPDLTIQALDQGCLEELFSRCSTNDLPAIAQTSKAFKDLLAESELIWAERLRADFSMNLDLHSSTLPGSLFPLAKQIYTAPINDETLRFQGVLVNGAVDDMNMWYWIDNLFKRDRSYFCSDASNNVDCLGLLLDNDVERDVKYTSVNLYMRRRCRYAAALFEHIHHPELANAEDILMNMVEEWSDQHLENFFLSLAENLQNDANNPVGRLLFYDVPEERIASEEQRIRQIVAYLKDRLKALKKDLIVLPNNSNTNRSAENRGPEKTLFDPTILPKLQPDYPQRLSSIIYELHLSRAGSLTCPVQTGVIFVGIINRSQLKGLDEKTVAERLQAATRDPVCSNFDGIGTMSALRSAIAEGKLPEVAWSRFDQEAGFSHEFEHGEDEEQRKTAALPVGGGKVPLISWKPLLWFKFNSAEDLEQASSDEDDENDDSISQEGEEEEEEEEEDVAMVLGVDEEIEEHPTFSIDAGSHGAHSGALEQQEEPWSDADLEDMSQGQPLVYPGGAAGAVGAGAGAAVVMGHPVAAGEHPDQEGGDDNGDNEGEEEDVIVPPFMVDHTIGRNQLIIPLKKPVVANVIMVKLINQENLMDELMDGHTYPNIDMTYVHIIGKKIIMPEGIDLKIS